MLPGDEDAAATPHAKPASCRALRRGGGHRSRGPQDRRQAPPWMPRTKMLLWRATDAGGTADNDANAEQGSRAVGDAGASGVMTRPATSWGGHAVVNRAGRDEGVVCGRDVLKPSLRE